MLALCFLSLVLFQSAFSVSFSSKQCYYPQGILAFCRDIDAKNFSALSAKVFQLDEKSAPNNPSNIPSWITNFFGKLDANGNSKNSTWTLRMPIHTRKIFLARMQNNRIADPVVLSESELEQRRVLAMPNQDLTKTSNCEFDPGQNRFVLLVNATDLNITEHAWYILCAEFNAMEDATDQRKRRDEASSTTAPQHGCSRCTMIRTTTHQSAGQAQFLQYAWLKSQEVGSGKGGVLHYTIADMPFASAKLAISITNLAYPNVTATEYTRVVKPKQEVFIRVPNWEELGNYAVKTDVYPQTEDGRSFNLDSISIPLVLEDYSRDEPLI